MAVTHNHYAFNPALPSGARLRSSLNQLENGRNVLIAELATMTADLEGDGSSDAHYSNVTMRYGFGSNEYAHAAYNELSSALAKLTTDAEVTFVQAALLQLFTRLR
jgi:hypothetical protein